MILTCPTMSFCLKLSEQSHVSCFFPFMNAALFVLFVLLNSLLILSVKVEDGRGGLFLLKW